MDICKYDIFTLHTTEQHWEGETPLENECSEYKCGQYLIFNFKDKFYVYKNRETDIDSPSLIGTYDTREEVDDTLGIKQ